MMQVQFQGSKVPRFHFQDAYCLVHRPRQMFADLPINDSFRSLRK